MINSILSNGRRADALLLSMQLNILVDELKEFVYNTRVYTEKWNLNRITWYSVFEQLDDANVSRQSVEEIFCSTGISEDILRLQRRMPLSVYSRRAKIHCAVSD